MVPTFFELLENRRLLTGAGSTGPVSEDAAVVRADRQQIHFDLLDNRNRTKIDERNTLEHTATDRTNIRDELDQLRLDRDDPQKTAVDLEKLKALNQQLATDIRAFAITARADQATGIAQLRSDRATLRVDLAQLQKDRRSSR
jgi:hypothetical protein